MLTANAVFVPVDMNAVQTERGGDRQDPSGKIELRFTCGRILCFDSGVNAVTLTRLIRRWSRHDRTGSWRSSLPCLRDNGHAKLCGDDNYAKPESPMGALPEFSTSIDST